MINNFSFSKSDLQIADALDPQRDFGLEDILKALDLPLAD
jgi:hypothetical protein